MLRYRVLVETEEMGVDEDGSVIWIGEPEIRDEVAVRDTREEAEKIANALAALGYHMGREKDDQT